MNEQLIKDYDNGKVSLLLPFRYTSMLRIHGHINTRIPIQDLTSNHIISLYRISDPTNTALRTILELEIFRRGYILNI